MLGVEGEDGLLVAPDEEGGRLEVPGQHVQPGQVQQRGHLPAQYNRVEVRSAPTWPRLTTGRVITSSEADCEYSLTTFRPINYIQIISDKLFSTSDILR